MIKILSKIKISSIKFLKKAQIPLVTLLVLFTVIFSLFRAMTPWVAEYKSEVIAQVSAKIGQKVNIESLETSWYWFKPVLKLNNVTISDADHHKVVFNKILVGINLWSSLWHRQLEPGILYIGNVDLVIHQHANHWVLDGLNDNKHNASVNNNSSTLVLAWLLSQDSVIVKQLSAKLYLANGEKIVVQDLNFKAVNSNNHYKIYGNAKLLQNHPTSLAIIADLQLEDNEINTVSGSVYLSLEKFLPEQWLRFVPKMSYQLHKGLCDLDLWVQIKSGKIKSVQSKIDFKNVLLVEDNGKSHKIDYFAANTAWRKDRLGWYFTADKVDLTFNGSKWPQNQIALTHNVELNSYNLFISNILIESLRSADIAWPQNFRKILEMHPTGKLLNTQLHIKDKSLTYVLTRFIDLGWDRFADIPEVRQISGAIYWEPTEGRLLLDGENTKIAPNKYPEQIFDVLNADIYWKELNNGFRIDLDRFVLSNHNITLSATGVLDNFKDPNSNIRLNAEFSANEAQQFMAYIPSGHLKPKFEEWLKTDVKRVKNLSGRLLVNGSVDGFPYDISPGKFVVRSHVSGVDLAINNEWPLNRDIDADLEFNKRTFTANVSHANLKSLQIKKLNLAVNNIGYGTESLLIHGEVEAPGPDIKSYIFATPLKSRFARWESINIADPYWVDIKLDIPLYADNDHISAIGEMVFSENPVRIDFLKNHILVKDVSGNLKFNEYGLTDGELKGFVDQSPLSLHARAMIEPQEKTMLAIQGETSIETLKKLTNASILNLFTGSCTVSGLWTIYPTTSIADTLHLETNLEGVAISLPAPLKKSPEEATRLSLDLYFKENNKIESKIYFNKFINSKLLFSDTKDGVSLLSGELKIGEGVASLPTSSGLNISGDIEKFNLSEWQNTLSQLPKDTKDYGLLDFLSLVNLKIKKIILSGIDYTDVVLNAKKQSDKWIINLSQDKLIANLEYVPKTNSLSGKLNKLTINSPDKYKSKKNKLHLSQMDIPNLDLEVENLYFKNINTGTLHIKSKSQKKSLNLESLEIKSPYYTVNADGVWTTVKDIDKTSLKFDLKINDLSKSLERLNITPIVYSKNGNVHFEGNYLHPIYDFSLKDLSGFMFVIFKNGRISHFDKELEEKIGLAKILSILSLQTIPRRLKLDFSDLSENGYTFDLFKGTFEFANGIMTTHDSYIDGPVAYAKITGNLDLNKQLYDVNLRITPYITASLPVVATIAGGPVAGLATWVASNIINKGMQSISGYTYRVSGPWSDPVVQQVKIYRKTQEN